MESSYRWVIVGLGALMTCVAVGAMFSLAVFLDPLTHDTQWSRAGISSAMTINFIVMGLGAFMWGAISDRHGPRIVVLIGAVLLDLALVLASRAQSLIVSTCLVALAGEPFTIAFDNRYRGFHGTAQHRHRGGRGRGQASDPIFKGDLVDGPDTIDYEVPAIPD